MAHPLKCLILTIGCPKALRGKEGRYEQASFYCDLLGMKIVKAMVVDRRRVAA